MNDAKDRTAKNDIFLRPTIIVLGILLMLVGIIAAHSFHSKHGMASNAVAEVNGTIRLDTQTSKFILKNGMPFLEKMVDEDDPLTFLDINWIDIYWHLAANIKNTSPLEIIRTQLPLLALVKVQPKMVPKLIPIPIQNTPEITQQPPMPTPENQPINSAPKTGGDPVVFIYHTHTSESYIPASGKDHLLNQKGDVVKAGTYLEQVLEEKYHLKCMHSEAIHDQFPFRDSYKRSQVTVINYLKQYPATKVVLDLHRDATPGLANSRVIKGQKCATIVTVVGSDKMGLPHPHWKENLEFAKKLNENMELFYPGLSNGIIISDARYNQHLHTHAILIEFGDQFSTLEEVYHAVDLFAEVLALTINKDTSPGVTTIPELLSNAN
jgi:stage II sporulation protein P